MAFKQLVAILATFFLFQNVSAFGIDPGISNFDVIANKTYSQELCVIHTDPNTTYYFTVKDEIYQTFEMFNFTNNQVTATKKNQRLCTEYSFVFKSPKNINLNQSEYSVYASLSNPDNGGLIVGMRHRLLIDSYSIDYKNALYQMSYKFVLFFVSIFSVSGLLLYIMKSKKINE